MHAMWRTPWPFMRPRSKKPRTQPQKHENTKKNSSSCTSQPFDASELAEVAVESAKGQVTSFPSNLQHQAVRKTHCRPSAKAGHSRSHGFRILNRQMLVIE